MADKKLNEVSQLTNFDYALVVKGNDVAKVSKAQLASIVEELLSSLGLFPFMYRGRIIDVDLATENGCYEMYGGVSNAPFSQSWGPLIVAGNAIKCQFAIHNVSDSFGLYVRALGSVHGWKQITLT